MILYIDACARKESRTRKLADDLAAKLRGDVEKVVLYSEDIPALDEAGLAERDKACGSGDFSADTFRYAKQFASADTIVIAAPFWDLSFPAILKKYIETICVVGITFKYSEQGFPVGLCRAKKVYYVTTSGGPIFNREFGEGYIRTLSQKMFGISEFECIDIQNLDVK